MIPPLQAEGYQVVASQHGLDSLEVNYVEVADGRVWMLPEGTQAFPSVR